MKFITFQPYDWNTTTKYDTWHDIYWEELGFDPVWCFPAESLKQAVINGVLTCPTTPEKVIFFKTNDFYMVSKVDHYNYLLFKDKDKRSVLLSKLGLKTWLANENVHVSITSFLSDYSPYQFEYLINPQSMDIIAEIDIHNILDKNGFYEEPKVNLILNECEKDAKADFKSDEQPFWLTEKRYIRNSISNLKWQWYIKDNDFFISDYKRIFGMKNTDKDITMYNIDCEILDNLIYDFSEQPSEEKLKNVINYIKQNNK